MGKYIKLLSKKTRLKCIGIIFLAFISAVLGSIWPVKLGELYTNISVGTYSTIEQGIRAIIMFGFVYLSAECINTFRRVALDCTIASQEAETREQSVEKLLKMPVSYFNGGLSGERTAQLNQGINGLSQLVKMFCNDIFATILTAVCTLFQVLTNAPGTMTLVMIAYLAIAVVISAFQIKSQNGIREKIIRKRNTCEGEICQSISNLELIRAMNAAECEKERLRSSIRGICATEKMHHKYMGTFDGIKQVFKIVFQVILIVFSVKLIEGGNMAPGTVITVCLLFQQLVKPVDDVYRFMDEIASSVVKAKTLIEVTNSGRDPVFDIESKPKTIKNSSIVLNDVVIKNPEGTKVLAVYDNVEIPRNKKVALVGPNGCGKTTLVRSLIRFYTADEGEITILGNNQNTYSQEELTSMIYYSPQNSFFIAGTVRDNLTFGIPYNVPESDLVNALNMVRLCGDYEGVISEAPKAALDFELSEGAKELSGGMKQRLALARAFLRKPKFFIFDEITANLDDYATDFVLSNIEEYAGNIGAGVVYISHEEKVVNRCDMKVYLNNLVKLNKQSEKVA